VFGYHRNRCSRFFGRGVRGGAEFTLFFKLISKRYEKTSTIITSNKAFEEWGDIFADDVVAAAILDRLLHHCYPFFIQGKSYRLKEMMGKKKE